ncbi:MAG: TauD/TfdA family dioxygenase [Myxococcales bacterium]|nr:TauD/TfdA family dioxygenase [Myxococcales bacterium]
MIALPRYRSQIAQSLHYFARPHERVRRQPLRCEAAWRGDELGDATRYRDVLDEAEADEILAAVRHARALGRPTGELRERDFPLPTLARKIDRYRRAIRHGLGFQLVSGVPVDRMSEQDAELFFWCFGLHLGIPGAQNPAGELLGHVRDTGAPPDGTVRQYRTREHIDFHCDLADVVGLLCLETAASGGRSRIASSVTAYNTLLAERPDLVERLYQPFLMDTKGEGGVPYIPIVPCAHAADELRTFWHIGYFRSVARLAGAPPIDQRAQAVIDFYDEAMNAPGAALEMDFAAGDIQLLSNHTIVHARTGYEDAPASERKRHLLRLWLSLPEQLSLPLRLRKELSRARVLGTLISGRIAHKLR